MVVGVNKWQEGEPSPLQSEDGGIMVVDPGVEADQIARLDAWRAAREASAYAASASAARPSRSSRLK